MRGGQQTLEDIVQQLKGADAFAAEQLMARARKLLANSGATGLVEDAVQQAAEVTEKYKSEHPELEEKLSSLSGLQRQFAVLASQIAQGSDPQDPGAAFNANVLDLLRKRLAEDQGKGEVSEGRAKALSGLIDRLGRTISPGEGLDDLRKTSSGIRELMAEAGDYAQDRQRNDLAGCGPAARRVYGGLSKMLVEVTRTSTDGTEEGEVCHELFQDMLEQLSYLRQHGLSEEAALEREATAWSVALKAQQFWRRHHVMVVEPLSDSPPVQMRPRRLFSAGDSFTRAVEQAAARLGAEVLPRLPPHAMAQGRWDQLRSCGVALFDFGDWGLQRPQAAYELGVVRIGDTWYDTTNLQRAQTAYELGMALALGIPSVVFATGRAPFDVDLPVRQLKGTSADVDVVEAGIAEAVFTPARLGQVDDPGALADQTLAHFEQDYGEALERSSGTVAIRMVREASGDSYAFARTMETVLRTAKLSKPRVVRPAWPPHYPDGNGGKPVCFHVTPFAPEFDEQRDAAKRACDACGFRYVRHDMTTDPRIIRSLWREILGADRILVDLTDANPNVALELGLAHAIGKNVLLVAEEPVERFLFPSVRQIQTIKYARGDNSFEAVVKRWLS
jgi:nucleoside 2-deoxyribosyltransferase